ncbi:MAG: prolyl aminopeptidase [Alphaproteobacteria bacterium]|nr:prolyl aminopeptidase [Alphaproteobacteria bacterium]
MSNGDLFPEIAPFETGHLPLSDGHVMYWEQVGNPRGVPVLFLHGGPGAGAGPVHRRFFDPAFWRLIVFDQRGSGRSKPLAGIEGNTTPHLVADIELLRRHLRVPKFLLFGGSWGSTLALAFAQAHPDRVIGCVLRGIFLGRPAELDWFLHGIATVFPEAHAAFAGHLPESERGELLANYLRRLTDPNPAVHMPAARAWSLYEGSCSTLMPNPDSAVSYAHDRGALALARLEAHYFAHGLFLGEDGLLGGMDRIAHIPAAIIQGRYDMICPPCSAFDLAAAWPAARLTMIPDAGHSALEPGTRRALVAAVEWFRTNRPGQV